jgi:hypothetical protein
MMNMNKIKILMMVMCVALMVLGMVSSASALYVIDTAALNPPVTLPISPDPQAYSWGWVGNSNSNSTIMNIILDPAPALLPGYTELYKVTREDGSEAGSLQGSYSGSFTDVHNGTITYDGGAFVGSPPTAYLLVKDGNAVPNWYLIALSEWDGKDTISVKNFFQGEFGGAQGGISHVSLIGVSTTNTQLPEPLTLLLLGLGLVGVAGVSRFRM